MKLDARLSSARGPEFVHGLRCAKDVLLLLKSINSKGSPDIEEMRVQLQTISLDSRLHDISFYSI